MRYVLLLIGTALAGGASSLWGQAPRTHDVAALIEQLGDDNYARRYEAADALRVSGMAAQHELTVAEASSADPEIRLRARGLLHNLQEDELWQGSRVSIDVQEQPVSKVLLSLTAQTGTVFRPGDNWRTFREFPVSVSATAAPFWEVLDAACQQSGNQVHMHSNHPQQFVVSQGLIEGEGDRCPTGYAGPLRVQLTKALRSFSEVLDYERMHSTEAHTFAIDLELLWESSFRLVARRARPLVVQAVADTGFSVKTDPTDAGDWMAIGSWSSQTTTLRFHAPPTSAQFLQELHLRWDLIAVGDVASLEITEFSPATYYQDDVQLELESMTEDVQGRHIVHVKVTRDFVGPELDEVSLVEHELELFNANGQAFEQSQVNKQMEKGSLVTAVSYAKKDELGPPACLRLTYPRLRSRRAVDIVIYDIPLPHAAP